MQNYYFEMSVVPLELLVLFAIYYRKTDKGIPNRIFIGMNILNLTAAVVDVINGAIKTPLPANEAAVGFSYAFSTIYFLLRNSMSLIFLLFLVLLI